jgi:hypothetical protein
VAASSEATLRRLVTPPEPGVQFGAAVLANDLGANRVELSSIGGPRRAQFRNLTGQRRVRPGQWRRQRSARLGGSGRKEDQPDGDRIASQGQALDPDQGILEG